MLLGLRGVSALCGKWRIRGMGMGVGIDGAIEEAGFAAG